MALDGLAAHEGDDGLRGVVAAGLVASRDEFLEDPPEHLRVYGHLHVERRALRGGEVEASEEPVDYLVEALVRYVHPLIGVVLVLLEEPAVEVGDGPNNPILPILAVLGVEALEEQGLEARGVEAAVAVAVALVRRQERVEIIRLPVQAQPALLLDEGHEHEPVEEPLGEVANVFFPGDPRDAPPRRS